MDTHLDELRKRRTEALGMGGPRRIARQHASGRLTARERIDLLIDPGSWFELGLLTKPELRREGDASAADGVVTGWATVDGRRVAVIAIDATVLSGTTAAVNARKQTRLITAAGRAGLPIITLADADGGRMPDIMGWRFGGLPLDFKQFLTPPDGCPSVPRLVAALGPCYGDSALQAAAGHFTVMTEQASVALSGPSVVSTAIAENVTHLDLGGPEVAAAQAGTSHAVVADEQAAIAWVRRALGYLPDHAAAAAPVVAPLPPAVDAEALLTLVPTERKRGYDMRKVLAAIVDRDSLLQWCETRGKSVITALARIEGGPVGIVASQPMQRAGTLDVEALDKYLGFIEICDTFNIPLVMLHDVPGLMIGTQEERRGVLRYLERIAVRLSTAAVPRVSVIVRKSYGGGYFLMGGSQTSPDMLVCWPTAELGFMAPEAGVRTVHRGDLERELAQGGTEARDRLFDKLTEEWQLESEPWEAAAHFFVDDVIDPRETRRVITTAIDVTWGNHERVRHRT